MSKLDIYDIIDHVDDITFYFYDNSMVGIEIDPKYYSFKNTIVLDASKADILYQKIIQHNCPFFLISTKYYKELRQYSEIEEWEDDQYYTVLFDKDGDYIVNTTLRETMLDDHNKKLLDVYRILKLV